MPVRLGHTCTMVFTQQDAVNLRASLQDAVVKCSERCLYQSAKWSVRTYISSISSLVAPLTTYRRAAELLDVLPEPNLEDDGVKLNNTPRGYVPAILTANPDEKEAQLEAREFNKYLLAKSFFDCREFDRCTAVFLPDSLLSSVLSPKGEDSPLSSQLKSAKGKESMVPSHTIFQPRTSILPELSQKSLFLALYAKMLSGEKRKDEDSEMVMGPQDLGSVGNKQLPVVSRYLQTWFDERSEDQSGEGSQGWLEYLYVSRLKAEDLGLLTPSQVWYGSVQGEEHGRSDGLVPEKRSPVPHELGLLARDDFCHHQSRNGKSLEFIIFLKEHLADG